MSRITILAPLTLYTVLNFNVQEVTYLPGEQKTIKPTKKSSAFEKRFLFAQSETGRHQAEDQPIL